MNKILWAGMAFLAGIAVFVQPRNAAAAPETMNITVGLPVTTSTFLPIYLADKEGLFKKEGLNVKLVTFHGGTDLVRGMIAGAVDVGVTALPGVLLGIGAGQPIKAFYGGFNMAVFDWYATKNIKSVKDAKGKRFGVTRIGSSTDFLTRYALKSRGIDPKKDATIVQGGGSAARLSAMQSGQLDVNVFAAPEKFMAADMGYNRILRQSDIAPDYPYHVFFATETFLKEHPKAIRALLRGFVEGVRLAKTNKDLSVKVLTERVGMAPQYAGRTYDDFIDHIYEDGRLPSAAGMKAFWETGIEAGQYKAPWPTSKFLDPTYIETYAHWKP
jgi:NitT/TauT family transport system substrate-binding protein